MPKGSFFPKPFKRVTVEFLKPIYPKNMSNEHISNSVRDKIKENLKKTHAKYTRAKNRK